MFYAYWSKVYVLLLLWTVGMDFYIARKISQIHHKSKKRLLMIVSMTVNLSILGFFKYYNFLATSVIEAAHQIGFDLVLPLTHVILPIGISFYTFQSMSYVIDVYRGVSHSHGSLLSFAGYVTLFPHQISGPLVRHNVIVPQLETPQTYFFQSENFLKGLFFLILGLGKKLLIADLLAVVVSPLVTNMHSASNFEAWIAMLGYTLQLYFDFSGYSDMAVGLGYLMNIQFPQNFNSPYKSQSITEFWQRWHITLSSWLRVYLYISLGGNRISELKTYRNLFITMALGGLWHGASWTYLAWGCFHGVLLSIERFCKDWNIHFSIHKHLHLAFTFFLVNLGWIFFRSPDFTTAKTWFTKIFLLNPQLSFDILSIPERHKDRFFIALAVGFLISLFCKNSWEIKFKPSLPLLIGLGILFAVCLMYMGDESPFLYFQF